MYASPLVSKELLGVICIVTQAIVVHIEFFQPLHVRLGVLNIGVLCLQPLHCLVRH